MPRVSREDIEMTLNRTRELIGVKGENGEVIAVSEKILIKNFTKLMGYIKL